MSMCVSELRVGVRVRGRDPSHLDKQLYGLRGSGPSLLKVWTASRFDGGAYHLFSSLFFRLSEAMDDCCKVLCLGTCSKVLWAHSCD